MRQKIADAIGTSDSNVNVKATTNEELGPIGRGEGMAAIAIATIEITDIGD
jgi:2-C-methyl-D-erythritol 2,4-cyclodiphosphate synthase